MNQLFSKILKIKAFALSELTSHFLSLALINTALHFLNQADNVSHSQNPGGNPIGVKGFECIDCLTYTEELDRL